MSLTVTNPVTADELLARLVWVVTPTSQTVPPSSSTTFTVLTGQDVLSGGDVIPGFQIKVEEIFVE